jgi:putative ATPase
MRPKNLAEFFGQEDLLGKKSFLRSAIENDRIPSMIFWGPPGCGKTTLARIIAENTDAEFLWLSAVLSGKKNLLEIFKIAEEKKEENRKTILFVDEIHRWSKLQQDALLSAVEKGAVTLIGATTENPSFEINPALLSRARVFVFKKLNAGELEEILLRAIKKNYPHIDIEKDTVKFIANFSAGDARIALNILEASAGVQDKIKIDLVKNILQKNHLFYDKTGEEHHNIISALHKSMRGSDADASVYWLARMLEGGEDPLYIARRLLRFAAEDVGLANNSALLVANAVYDAAHKIGMPECSVHLAQCVIYLAKSKKDITAYAAYGWAKADVEKLGNLPVPMHIRNAPTRLMKDLGYGAGYKYTPLEDSSEQKYLPKELEVKKYV